MTSAIGSSFGATFASPGIAPPRGGTQPEVANEELRRTTQTGPAPARPDQPPPFEPNAVQESSAAEETRPTFSATAREPGTAPAVAQPTEQQVEQARSAGQTRGSFLDIRA